MGGTTDLETLNLNLSGAYRLNDHWSFGLGFDAVYARAKLERYAGDLPDIIGAQLPGMVKAGKLSRPRPRQLVNRLAVSAAIRKSLV